jgi:cytochrome c oxidase assembly factor CtaG
MYLYGWVRIRRFDRGIFRGWHAASFGLGLLCIWIATASPLAALDHEMLTGHMVQHLLLMTIAPPLILLDYLRRRWCMAHRTASRWRSVIHCDRLQSSIEC